MELKHIDIELKLDEETRTIEGYASVFGNVDSYNDIVLPGAFAKTLKKQSTVPMLWQHDPSDVIGMWTQMEERDKGLYVKGSIIDTVMGGDAYKLAKAGAVKGMSIGYSAEKYEIDQDKGTRKLIELKLYEVSLVTFPANAKATVTAVKSLENIPFEQLHERKNEIEAALRDAGASQRVAKYIASLVPQPAQRDAEGDAHLLREIAHTFNQFTHR